MEALTILKNVSGKSLSVEERTELSVQLAEAMLIDSSDYLTPYELKQMAMLHRLSQDLKGKLFTTSMTDECFRVNRKKRIAEHIVFLLKQLGVPKYLDFKSKLELICFKYFGVVFSEALIPLVKKAIHRETERVILPGESQVLKQHLLRRKNEGVTTNLNHLGEAILGEEDAKKRMKSYCDDLSKPEVEYISVKISTLYSQISTLATDECIAILKDRLKVLYRLAIQHQVVSSSSETRSKFINLDMEEYRDLHLTIRLFKEVLSENEFKYLKAGIVLQAYLPDSYEVLVELTEWAKKRVSEGGAPIKVRIVKGANLAMEKIEASLKGWPQAPFGTKIEVDSHYRKMIHFALSKENAPFVQIGVASHNLFDIANALLLRSEQCIEAYVNFEMLEGMADHLRLVVQQLSGDMVLYCPAAEQKDFLNAIAYLIRRLDENTAPDNFLKHLFEMKPYSKNFQEQAEFFRKGCQRISSLRSSLKRIQNRNVVSLLNIKGTFENSIDTDFSLIQNLKWAGEIYKKIQYPKWERVKSCINGIDIETDRVRYCICPDTSKSFSEVCLVNAEGIEKAITCAENTFVEWNEVALDNRIKIIETFAQYLHENRRELIEMMMIETGKVLYEADVEVSEAIDFCLYYSRSMKQWSSEKTLLLSGIGPVLVTPPWNFPCAIPVGGIVSGLVTGNSVIFKPAPEASCVGALIVKYAYLAGVPKNVLQYLNCQDEPEGSLLIKDSRIKGCILTGATETARKFMTLNPRLNLLAETGGKNGIYLSDLSDRDLAIKDIVHSAFAHAGQKCSACSLLFLHETIYEDKEFLVTLRDAAASLKVGLVSSPSTFVNPLIHPPVQKLKDGLLCLEEGETWLLKPEASSLTPHLWSPGIKIGVKKGSKSFKTEFFGPVLSIVKVRGVKEAVSLSNSLSYGLTAGIHSLDETEKKYWLENIEVGNAYLNRGITGAIVHRQPFGGVKSSSFGRGLKAGGPNYLVQLMHIKEKQCQKYNIPMGIMPKLDAFHQILIKKKGNRYKTFFNAYVYYVRAYNEMHLFQDHSNIRGQENYTLYKCVKKCRVFIQTHNSELDYIRVLTALMILNVEFDIIISPEYKNELFDEISNRYKLKIIRCAENHFYKNLLKQEEGVNRFIGSLTDKVKEEAAKLFIYVQGLPVYQFGKLELLNYLYAMTVSDQFHRYGSLGKKKHN